MTRSSGDAGSSRRVRRMQVRIRVVFVLTAFVLSMFGARLIQLQGVDASAYASMAADENSRTIELHAERGEILDRDGDELATSVDGVALTADPTLTADDAPAIAAVLTREAGLDYFDTVEQLRTPDTRFVWLQRKVPVWQAEKALAALSKKKLAGVFSLRDPFRTYPAGDVAGNVLGFLDVDGEAIAGLEAVADDTLSGADGSETYMVAANGAQIPMAPSSRDEPEQGTGLALTLDRDLQWWTQRRLRTAVRETGADSATAVLTHVETGQVLSLAEWPTVDPNNPGSVTETDRGSRAVQNVFEPGSVQKLMTFAALLDRGIVTPRTKINVPATRTFDGEEVGDWWDHGRLRMTATGVLAQSSNLGTITAASSLPDAVLERYLRKFGLGQRTGIGLPGESPGIVNPASDWLDITRANIAFGQGLSTTAVQMAAAVNTVANDGVYVAPSLMLGELRGDGVEPAEPPATHRVVSVRAAEQLQRMMEEVTAPNGTAPAAAIPGYRVAGKTGTAERVSEAGGYDGTVISFAGFAPADDPRLSMYIVLDNPDSGAGGGSGGGPIFADVMSYALNHYAIPPTGQTERRLPSEW